MKKIFYFSFVIVASFFVYLFYLNKEDIFHVSNGGKFNEKIYYNNDRSKQITLLLHTDGVFSYKTYIYMIHGIYHDSKIPEIDNFVKFPNGTGVFVQWGGMKS